MVRVTLDPVGLHSLQKLTVVVVQISVIGATVVWVDAAVRVASGKVRVTVVGVAAQAVQTAVVVYHPSGTAAVVVAKPAPPVAVA